MNRKLLCWIIILLVSLYGCNSKTVNKEAEAKNDSIRKYIDLAGDEKLDFEKENSIMIKRTHYWI